eukprot:COSAG02_NODE_10691_length_1882_cov_11.169938_1_plen_62_part_00
MAYQTVESTLGNAKKSTRNAAFLHEIFRISKRQPKTPETRGVGNQMGGVNVDSRRRSWSNF